MAKITLPTIASGYASITQLNSAFDSIEQEFNNKVLYRDNPTGEANQMEVSIDMNNNSITNVDGISTETITVDGIDLTAQITASQASSAAAAASATAAANSASSASGSASTATTGASTATTQASNASTSASAASTSASNAATSASAAATSATNAASSASSASTSASTATTQATNASSSATAAQSAQTAAESARDSTLAAFDSFDDRYLGAKASDPSVDNDGNALIAGALYFNSSSGVMKLYTGSAWVAAYVSGDGFVAQTAATGSADIPSGTTAERDASPGAGYFRFNSEEGAFEGYDGSVWGSIGGGGGATGAGGDTVFQENSLIVTTSYTLSTGKSAMSVGPITINGGAAVTVPSGARWVIL